MQMKEIAQAMPDARPAIVLLLGRILIAYYTFFSIGLPVPLLCIVLRHAAVCVGDTSGVGRVVRRVPVGVNVSHRVVAHVVYRFNDCGSPKTA